MTKSQGYDAGAAASAAATEQVADKSCLQCRMVSLPFTGNTFQHIINLFLTLLQQQTKHPALSEWIWVNARPKGRRKNWWEWSTPVTEKDYMKQGLLWLLYMFSQVIHRPAQCIFPTFCEGNMLVTHCVASPSEWGWLLVLAVWSGSNER